MDNNGTTIVDCPPPSSAFQPPDGSSKDLMLSNCNNLKLVFPFNIPPTLDAGTSRIITNLDHYKICYSFFVWLILFIVLLPKRKVSLIFLVGMTNVICLYLLLLRSFPNSAVLHQIVDKRLVLFSLAIMTIVEMILTRATIHLLLTLVGATPLILVHALLRVRYCLFVREESCVGYGLVPIVYFVPFVNRNGEYDPLRAV